jgi:putative peptidoglycan lipid II flippase
MAPERQATETGRGLIRGFADIGAGTFVSRLSGFAREVVTAAFFGAGTEMDIFVAAFTIPNLLCRVLGESAVESGFMPLFKGMHARGEARRAWSLAGRTANALALTLLVVVIAGIGLAPFLVRIVAHGFEGEVARETVRMTRLMFPFGLAIGMAALMGAILLAFGRYRVYSLAPVLLNVGIVGSVLALSGRLSYTSLAIGVLVGGALQFLVQVPFARAIARSDGEALFRRGAGPRDRDLREVGRLTGPVVVASAIERVGVIVDRTVASFLAPGSISSLYYSFRIVHLPYAILALAAGRSAAPVLAETYALGRHDEFRSTLVSGYRMNLSYLVPVVILSVWFARPVVGLVYQRGAFDETDLAMTASAFALYSVGLVGMGIVFLLVRAFAARLDTRTPVRVSVAAFILHVALDVILVRTPLRHAGVALATSLTFIVHAVALHVILNRDMRARGAPIAPSDLLGPASKIALSSVALVAVLWLVDSALGMRLAESRMMGRIVRIAAAGGAGLAAYVGAAALLKLPEIVGLLGGRGRRAK